MFIYCNIKNNKIIEDYDNLDIYYEDYIYTSSGIYKKYKKHYYLLNIENNNVYQSKIDSNFFIQKSEYIINKNNLLTYIPYNHYIVNRKIIKSTIDDDIIFVKEIDNKMIDSHYFITNNDDNETLKKICLFLNKKV